jgi:hypothetical protein
MQGRDKQINEMIGETMKLAQAASSLELTMVSCLFRMVLLELTNLNDAERATVPARDRVKAPAQ